jgi:hypothetical protein
MVYIESFLLKNLKKATPPRRGAAAAPYAPERSRLTFSFSV